MMKKKILIVDDDPNILDYLESLFKDNGYDTAVAKDAIDGFQVARKYVPDLITLDIEMPGDWGPRLYHQIVKEDALKNIPFVVISGLSGNTYAVPSAIATIKKPFDPGDLLSIVKKAIG